MKSNIKTVRRYSGSLYIAISAIADQIGIKEGDKVEVIKKGKSIVVKKVKGDK